MAKFVSLLRGINVGGHNKVKMNDLSELHQKLGHTNVQTYLQTGNVVFEADKTTARRLAAELKTTYAAKLNLEVGVVVRDKTSILKVIEQCPIALNDRREPKFLLWTALATKPTQKSIQLLYDYDGPEVVHVKDDNLYIYYTNGVGRSKLTMDLIERRLQTTGTGRNWNTALKIAAMMAT